MRLQVTVAAGDLETFKITGDGLHLDYKNSSGQTISVITDEVAISTQAQALAQTILDTE